jgi:predicted GNAT family acetyltransferase
MKTIITNTEIQLWEGDELLGKIVFELDGNHLSILHTYAYQSGRGIGTQLMHEATQWAQQQGYTIIPICSFAKKYLEKQ